MATYSRETRVAAPLEEVWEFHSRVDGLEALTPSFVNLRVERVVGPDGEPNPDVLEAGSRIYLSTSPLGVPGGSFVSVITSREYDGERGQFVDRMEDGPFQEWEHTHTFRADGDGTVLRDEVTYSLPGGGVGRALSPIGWLGFEPAFRYRHRRTKQLLESEDAGRTHTA